MEVVQEAMLYGNVVQCLIYQMPPSLSSEDQSIRVFLSFQHSV